MCTESLTYGTLNETVCKAWAKLCDIFSLGLVMALTLFLWETVAE